MATYAAYRHIELDNIGYGKKRVLKPPGGGSSDIFGASDQISPRRIKNHNQSQLGSGFFSDGTSTGSTSPDSPRGNKPGNDSYKRLFGPPEPATPNTKNHMRSNISLSNSSDNYNNSLLQSPIKNNAINHNVAVTNGNSIINGNAIINDNTAFRRHKRFRGSSCMPRNPVTGDGIDMTPMRRNLRKCREGNPVTGSGYSDHQNNAVGSQNGGSSGASSINGDNRSTTDSASVTSKPARGRVPPGGFSSGLW